MNSEHISAWFLDLLGLSEFPTEGQTVDLKSHKYIVHNGMLRGSALHSLNQQQTSQTFGFKWDQRDFYDNDAVRDHAREWLNNRYLPAQNYLEKRDVPTILDAGCGAGLSALEYFGPVFDRVRYVGADISTAVDVARERLKKFKANTAFIQADLLQLPFAPGSFDIIFSEGVLHHTDSTEQAIKAIAPLLKRGGVFMFYVYRRKGPIREYTDDYIRSKIQDMPPEQAWQAMLPLTKLGKTLGDLDIEINIDEPIDLLGIPAGRINLQRLFYWHVVKAFYRPDYSMDAMNHVNFDWFAPRNAHRQSPEQVRQWCAEAGLTIMREQVEDAGITIVATS